MHPCVPGAPHGAALKDAGQNEGESLAGDDSHHDDGHFVKDVITESHIQREHGELDEAQRSVVEDGREINNLKW